MLRKITTKQKLQASRARQDGMRDWMEAKYGHLPGVMQSFYNQDAILQQQEIAATTIDEMEGLEAEPQQRKKNLSGLLRMPKTIL